MFIVFGSDAIGKSTVFKSIASEYDNILYIQINKDEDYLDFWNFFDNKINNIEINVKILLFLNILGK